MLRRRRCRAILTVALTALLLGGWGALRPRPTAIAAATRSGAPVARISESVGDPQALVTDETESRLLVVDLRTVTVVQRIAVPAGPQYVAAERGFAVVSSTSAGTVELLSGPPWHVTRTLHGFRTPRLVEFAPDGQHIYITDDAAGMFDVFTPARGNGVIGLHVGTGAHHFSSSPDQRRVWVALGEAARTIVVIDTSHLAAPRVLSSFTPGFAAHDLAFSSNGRAVWVSSADDDDVHVLAASDRHQLFQVAVGPPPQHIALAGPSAYLTSGYGSTIERVDQQTGRIVARASVPYGSFELDAGDGYIVTSSLLDGKLAVLTPDLTHERTIALAPATRDIAIVPR